MILFFLFVCILIYTLRKGKSIATLLSILYLLSLGAAYLWSPSVFFTNRLDYQNILFLLIFYTLLILAWDKFYINSSLQLSASDKELKLYGYSKYIGLLMLLINLYFFYILSNTVTDYSDFKNGGDAAFYKAQLPIRGLILTLFNWLSMMFLLILPYHFHFLSKGKKREAVIALLVSLNYVMVGMSSFSRSSMVIYILMYIILFIYFRKHIRLKFSSSILIPIVGVLLVVIFTLYSITINRFAGDNINVSEAFVSNDAIVDDAVVNAQLSYFSQWYNKSEIWLPKAENLETTHGARNFPLVATILSSLKITPHFPEYLDQNLWKQQGSDSASLGT